MYSTQQAGYSWKWCECCHVVNQSWTDGTRDRHNLTYVPWNNMYNASLNVVQVTNCTWCHNATIYDNARQTYYRDSPNGDCRKCHTFPDKLPESPY